MKQKATMIIATTIKYVQPISKSSINKLQYLIKQFDKNIRIILLLQPAMNEVVIKVIGNYSYQTSRCLGQGVYGKVYEGMQRQSKQKVAIKKIDLNIFTNDKYLENAIFSEIYLLKRFNHPNIVKFKDVLSSKNSLYIITEFCKNGDLKEMIKRKRFKQEEALQIMRQLLSGFSELVREKIIHRDLKPANILINENVYKIGDFGFAKYVDNFGSQMLKSCVGSPIYMAPQILQRTQYTTKCDIWSLGIIFYEMIHGYPPWKARDEAQLLRSIKNFPIGQLLKRSNLSQRANEFLKRTLTFSEEQRITWNQLFDSFTYRQQKTQQIDKFQTKEKGRINSINSSLNFTSANLQHNQNSIGSSSPITTTNNNNFLSGQLQSKTQHKNISSGTTSSASITNVNHLYGGPTSIYGNGNGHSHSLNAHTNTNQRSKGVYNISSSNNIVQNNSYITNLKKSPQIQNILQWRQYLIYYHFYCVEMITNLPNIMHLSKIEQLFGRLFFALSTLIKIRGSFCLSMISFHLKNNKGLQDIHKAFLIEQQSYETTLADVISYLQKSGLYKNIKNEYSSFVGNQQTINQQKMQKSENYMVGVATQIAQVLSQQVTKRVKTITNKEYPLVEMLDNVLDVLRVALGKNRFLTEIQEDQKDVYEDIRDYAGKVFGKVDRVTANI